MSTKYIPARLPETRHEAQALAVTYDHFGKMAGENDMHGSRHMWEMMALLMNFYIERKWPLRPDRDDGEGG